MEAILIRELTEHQRKGGLHNGTQTMDAARYCPLRMWLSTRVPGTTLNCFFVVKEVLLREAQVSEAGRFPRAPGRSGEIRVGTCFHQWEQQQQRELPEVA